MCGGIQAWEIKLRFLVYTSEHLSKHVDTLESIWKARDSVKLFLAYNVQWTVGAQQHFLRTRRRWSWAKGSEMKRIKNSFPCGTQTHGQGQGKGSFPHCAHLAAWGLQVSLLGIQSTLGWLQGLVSSFFSTWSSESSRSVWNPSHFTLRILTAFVQGQKVAVSIQVHYWPLYSVPRTRCLFSS